MEIQKLSDSATLTTQTDEVESVEQSRPVRRIQLDLSLAQVAGGSLAAATAAALSSGLGVAGTIAGAAVISLVTAVAGALYTQSLRRTRTHARAAAALIAARRKGTDDLPRSGAEEIRRNGAEEIRRNGAEEVAHNGPVEASRKGTDEGPAAVRPPTQIALRPRRLVAGVLVVFALAVAGITGIELLTGHPLSGGDTGTTLGELTGNTSDAGSGQTEPAPADQRPTADPDTTGGSQAPTTQPTAPLPTESSPGPTSPTPTPTPSPSPDPSPLPTPPGGRDAPR